ncbi:MULTISPECIES: type IV pilus modification protein PilV [Acidovorax]|uniref:Type IV pilus modification protein PilV n=1 Tax=Acidovorax facilis TaxID=12917 RepID=A0ABV8D607_9BURK|nr:MULTISPECIES: type IV pilus modification protein PilV [Acidovorax]KQB61155.1 pilus assembly protein PilV [Acidovorax sp. SD340]MBO1007289.1 type IV pilus modification protein PilV [Acidovorax sp. SD340]MCO4240761.1 type IV pilus modification protein PilV [Acidovorax facilis]
MSVKNNRQRGVSLIESLVAIVVTALGILGILGVQLRTLADTQTGVRRAQAIRLIEDLSEHTKVNPNAPGNINSYLMNWGATPTAPVDCKTTPCNSQQLALYDVSRWRQAVTNALPNSDVNVFIVPDETVANNNRQLGVMVSWRENEKDTGTGAVFKITNTETGSVSCPANSICHLQYIQLTARCAPYTMGGPTLPQTFCPGV